MKIQKKKNKGLIFWCIWICILTFAVLSNVTYSKYIKDTQTSSNVIVAKPIITISKTTLNDANNSIIKREIAFTVQNYYLENYAQVSETTMAYYLNIAKKTALTVTYKLYKIDENGTQEVALTNNNTSTYTLPHTTNMEHSYILELTFTEPPSNTDIQDAITIKLHAEQVQ